MWLFWDLVSALPIFPRFKEHMKCKVNIKILGRWKWMLLPLFPKEKTCWWNRCKRPQRFSISPSLLPYLKGTGMCQTLGRWSWVSCHSCSRHAQSGRRQTCKQTNDNDLSDRQRKHAQNVLKVQTTGRMAKLTIPGSDIWQNFNVTVGIFWITKEWEVSAWEKK